MAAEKEQTMPEPVNEEVTLNLAEDAEDLAAFETRASEPDLPFEEVLKDLGWRG